MKDKCDNCKRWREVLILESNDFSDTDTTIKICTVYPKCEYEKRSPEEPD